MTPETFAMTKLYFVIFAVLTTVTFLIVSEIYWKRYRRKWGLGEFEDHTYYKYIEDLLRESKAKHEAELLDILIGDKARNNYYHNHHRERYKKRYGKYPLEVIGELGEFKGFTFIEEES